MIRDKVSSILKQKDIEPHLRTELHHLPVKLESADAQLITVAFNNRYYDEPTIIQGNGSVSYQTDDGKKYRVGLLVTVQEYLMDKDSNLIIGAKIFVRARQLPKKLTYPIYGQQDIVVMGKATTKYLGALDTAVPYIPQNGTQDDNDTEFENDAPSEVTGLTLTTGIYYSSDGGKGQTPLAYIQANWDAVVHNDLQGYESDISEGDNLHYDDKPDPKFNSSTMMAWTGLKLNTIYYIRVRAVDLSGNASDWVETSITTPVSDTILAPTSLVASSQPPRGIVLQWAPSASGNVYSYEIFRSTTDTFDPTTKIGETQATTYFDNNLTVGTTYYYWVRAVSTSGSYSDVVGSVSAVPYNLTDTDVQANSLYNALADGSVSQSKIQAGAVTADKIATGALLTYNGTFVNRLKKNSITFSVVPNATNGYQYVSFAAGSVDLVTYDATNGWGTITVSTYASTVYGNTLSPYIYVYITPTLDANNNPLAGTYSLYNSTSYPTASNAIVLFMLYTYYSSNLAQYTIDVQKLGSMGTIINGDHIQTGSITASNIKTGTITATQLAAGSVTSDKIVASVSLTSPIITGGTIQTASTGKRVLLDSTNTLSFYDSYGNLALQLYGGTTGIIFDIYSGGSVVSQIYNIDGLNTHITNTSGNIYLEAYSHLYISSPNGTIVQSGDFQVSAGKVWITTGNLSSDGTHLYWTDSSGVVTTLV